MATKLFTRALNARLAVLLDRVKELALERDRRQLLCKFCETARELIGARSAALGMVSADGSALDPYCIKGPDTSAPGAGTPPATLPLFQQILSGSRAFRFRELADTDAAALARYHGPVRAFLAVPLMWAKGRHGLLWLADKIGAEEFSADDEAVAVAVAGQAAVAYENVCRYDAIQLCIGGLESEMARRIQGEVALEDKRNRLQTLFNAVQGRARQQQAVALLGQQALADTDLPSLFHQAVTLVALDLKTELCGVLELLAEGKSLRLLAGTGWQDGLVGLAAESAEPQSQLGFTLLSNEPVAVADLSTDTRFQASPLLLQHGATSGMSVVIASRESPFGVLAAYTRRRETFSADDIHFLQAVANVLASAIDRKRSEDSARLSTQRLEAMHAIDQAILTAQSSEEIGAAALSRIRALIPCLRACLVVFNFETQEATWLAAHLDGRSRIAKGFHISLREVGDIEDLRQGHVRVVEDLRDVHQRSLLVQTLLEEGTRSMVVVPLLVQEQLIGSLNLGSQVPAAFSSAHVNIARQVAYTLAVAIQHVRLYEQVRSGRERLQALSRQLITAQEAERRHISRELHDQIGQTLTAVKINLQSLQRLPDHAASVARLEEDIGILERTLQQVRNLSLDLRPLLLDDLGLGAALRWYVDRQVQRAGFAAQVVIRPPDTRVAPEVEVTCFRVAQEAITNIMRHAQARQVSVQLVHGPGELEMTIRDDGVGFDVQAAHERAAQGASLGLLGMQERAELVGGRIDIVSAPGRGTEIRARFPLPSAVPEPKQAARAGA
jgi:signal transduction histidine kinase